MKTWIVAAMLLVLTSVAGRLWAEGGVLDSGDITQFASTTVTITVAPTVLTTGVAHVTNGTALRNACTGTIALRGIPAGATLKSAFLYWNFMNASAVGAATDTENFNGKSVVGTKTADQPDLCWATKGDHSYRAALTPLPNGNYVFKALNCSHTSGQNPWNPLVTGTPIEPAWDGVSLVETYSNAATASGKVAIFDKLAGASNSNAGNHNFAVRMNSTNLFKGVGLFSQVNADGQIGNSFNGVCNGLLCTDELDQFNGANLAGPGAFYPQSNWDGSTGTPLPMLWDTHTSEVTFNGTAINTDTTFVGGDCIAPVAYIEQQGGF
jgi:hypothetical protein